MKLGDFYLPSFLFTPALIHVTGQKLFRRTNAGSDSMSETSSLGPVDETSREECTSMSANVNPAVPQPETLDTTTESVQGIPEPVEAEEERQPEGQQGGLSGR